MKLQTASSIQPNFSIIRGTKPNSNSPKGIAPLPETSFALISDTHLAEATPFNIRQLFGSVVDKTIVIAGDFFDTPDASMDGLSLASKLYPEKTFLFTDGNSDIVGSPKDGWFDFTNSMKTAHDKISDHIKTLPNVHFIENGNGYWLSGYYVVGTFGGFDYSACHDQKEAQRTAVQHFNVQNSDATRFFRESAEHIQKAVTSAKAAFDNQTRQPKGIIYITHTVPDIKLVDYGLNQETRQSVSKLCDIDLILKRGGMHHSANTRAVSELSQLGVPLIVCSGHNHSTMDLTVGNTRYVSNAFAGSNKTLSEAVRRVEIHNQNYKDLPETALEAPTLRPSYA